MDVVDRRTFLRRTAFAAGAMAVALDPLRLVGPATASRPVFGELGPVPDLRDGVVRLWLPVGFKYRSFHDTESGPQLIDDGATVLPGRHDGMAAFSAPDENVWLIRNHEINNPGAAVGVGTPYDSMAQGITTTILVTPFGEVLDAFTSLNGTQMNCAGGATPWGTWIMGEETVNGPDVGADFTGVSNVPLTQRHGFIFEVPAGGQSNRQPITSAGRFAHEAAAWNSDENALYLTEDNFGFPSGFYRYFPPTDPMKTGRLADGGRLQTLRVVGQPNAHLEGNQANGATYDVDWVDIADPNPTFPYTPGQPAPTSNDDAISYVGNQGRAQGAAGFSGSRARPSQRAWSTSTPRRAVGRWNPDRNPSPDMAMATARFGRSTLRSRRLRASSSRRARPFSTCPTTSLTAPVARSSSAKTVPATTTFVD